HALERLGLPKAKPFTWSMGEQDGLEVMINRTGYTGEEGVELACMADDAPTLWDAIVARGVTPCGLGARDTLRLEVCYRLHRLGRARGGQGPRDGAEARPLSDDRAGDPAAGHGDRGASRRRRGYLG